MAPREPESERNRDENRPPNWREGHHGGAAEDSPDDYDETNPEEDLEASSDTWRRGTEGAEASPDDFDGETSTGSASRSGADAGTQAPGQAREIHTELQRHLGVDYEVIFEAEGYQVRRAGDRAFIAEYDPDHQVVSTGAHVLFYDRTGETRDKLIEEGRQRVDARIDQWKSFGFEPVEEGHLVSVAQLNSDLFKEEVPRYIQPMQKSVDSVDEAVEAVQWVRRQREF